jgi:acyl-CoA dehydrogenase
MNDAKSLIADAAERLFRDLCTPSLYAGAEEGAWAGELWDALEANGLASVAVSETRGGDGARLADVAALLRVAGRFAVPLPLAETILAEQLLAAAGLPRVEGPASIGPVIGTDRLTLVQSGSGWELSGTLHRVPWASSAKSLVLLADCGDRTVTLSVTPPDNVVRGWNYAHEARDTVIFDRTVVSHANVAADGKGWNREQLHARGALYRAVSMAGALEVVLEMAVQYAKERVQFGKPIGKFQAIQQQIAVLASEVAAASAAVSSAIDFAERYDGMFEIAAAKVRAGEAAGVAAAIAHQVHGAMGFTHEHALHRSTRRLWSWRDEFGGEVEWSEWIGRAAGAAAGDRGEDLWEFLTASEKVVPPLERAPSGD